ncbi:UDP-N-acetylglucosamine 2-epimerase [Lacrimispora defluvii]|uniref:UDP-N-acetylglucosamine 2-epimerase (Hydrolyzing) n=1 Tax=Lacrimispora defluvii TaxID=2719233 RepID=A0ABX1VV13_9FIRM|nr:UDP-N-acetylglucosamine 2-epimerase [Lacrimispora defluvii]NNJ32232.1 UDP-N-acetylglucosamine 2-epimerase (hydrolyzing) [Lacrimispora defluvii]
MIRLCVVTGSRAEYGLLTPLIRNIMKDQDLKLQLLVTGTHLDTRFGLDYQEMEQDGIVIDEMVEMNLASDTSYGICKSMGLELIGISGAYERLNPHMILLLGDRYEIFTAASAAVICKIPIAHIHGGELTQGAYDDCMRHGITKMSYLHFTSTEEYRKRVIQLGESPDRVFNVGALGIERIKGLTLLSKEQLEQSLHTALPCPFSLVTYHPATLDPFGVENQFQPLLDALDSFPELFTVFTGSNADTGGNKVNEMAISYTRQHPERAVYISSLGSLRYLSLMSISRLVIGNSSSGILEAPAFHVPTVDIGLRQQGRIKPDSVICCGASAESIRNAISQAMNLDLKNHTFHNPYDCPGTSQKILTCIKEAFRTGIHLEKEFYDIDWSM